MWNRRDALKMGLASWLLAGLSTQPLAGNPGRTGVGPRYVVVLMLRGGLDAVYSTDPKDRSEVDPRVDIPYSPAEVIETGDLRLGPHLGPLRTYAKRMAIVRGLQVRTANHESGALQMLRMRTAVSRSMPGILEIIGSRRDGQPLANVTLGRTSSFEQSSGSLGAPTGESDQTLFDALDKVKPKDFELLQQVYEEHARRVMSWPASGERDQTEEHLKQVSALFDRLGEVPAFQDADWQDPSKDHPVSRDLQRTLWLIQNDLTRGVYLKVYLDWDSHYDNTRKQVQANGYFFPLLARFLGELKSRQNAHGYLADNTLIVMGSELGRFPFLNGNQGKDHFPETNLVFMGPGVAAGEGRGAVYGDTGRLMEGQKVSLRTGRRDDVAGVNLCLDDVGATLLHMTGFQPELYGYRGNRLSFLEQT